MRQIHNAPQPEDKLKKELEEAGLVSGNVDWLMKYLDDKTPEDPALLEKAVHQAPRSFNQQQALNFALLLDRLLSHQNREVRYRAVKAFFSIFGPNLLQSSVTQARPWLNLQSRLSNMPLPLTQLIGPAAALALKAGYWNGGRDLGNSIKMSDLETVEKALEYSTDETDIARVVLGCVWLWKQGGNKDGKFAEMTKMVQESAAALVDLTAPGIDVSSRNLLAGYIRDGKEGPLPVKKSTLPGSAVNQNGYQYNQVNIRTNDAAVIGSACFLAMDAAPELVPAFLTYVNLCHGLTLWYSLDFAGEDAFRAKVPWLIENCRFSEFLWQTCYYDYYVPFNIQLAKDFPEQFEKALKGKTYFHAKGLYAIFEQANPQRAAALHEKNRPSAQQRAASNVSQGFANSLPDERDLWKFILEGEGLEALLKKHRITPNGGISYGGGNDASLYAQEYGLDSFTARCIIGQLFTGRSYMATDTWNKAYEKLPKEQQHMGTVLDALHAEGLPAADCLVLSEWEWDHSYNSKDKQEVMDQTVDWMLKQDEAFLPRVIEWCAAYSRSLAAYAYGKKGDFDAVLALAQDSSKQVRSAVADVFVSRPYDQGPKAVKALLQSKKAAQRETALTILSRLEDLATAKGSFVKTLRGDLEAALAKEKSLKLANTIRDFLGEEPVAAEGKAVKSLGDPVADVLKGGKKRKVQWILDGTQQLASRGPDGVLEEDRLSAVMVLCMQPGGLTEAKKLAEPLDGKELAAFAMTVFELWMDQGAPSKQKWVLTFCAVFGGNEIVNVLKRQINQWPQESRGAIACEAVNALALSPEPEALMIVDSISRKFKFKQVKGAAANALDYAAKELGMTTEELADRIVPDLGLDQRGQRVFDYGPRSFTVTLTPALELAVKNQDGKVLKTMPAPGKTDDPEKAPAASSEFKALKKQIKATISTQTLRLEQALSTGRTWTGEGWQELFVKKPVMRQFAVGLIWGVYDETGALTDTFRYLEDGSLNTADEEEYELAENVQVGLVHPVELDKDALAEWKQQLEDYEIKQPFLQLDRPVTRVTGEQAEETSLDTFGGRVLNGLSLTGKLMGQGWYRGSILDGGGFYDFYREDGPIGAQLNFEGASVGCEDGDTTVYDIQFYKANTVSRGSYVYDALGHGSDGKPVEKDERLLKLGQVPPRLFSEIVYQVQKATASSTETRDDWKRTRM